MCSELAPVSLQKSAGRVAEPVWGDRLKEFRHKDTVGFRWPEEDFVRDANPPGDAEILISRSRLQKHQKRKSFSDLDPQEQADLETAFRLASGVQKLPETWVALWMDYLFRNGTRPPNLANWRLAPAVPERRMSEAPTKDDPPAVSDLADLEGVRSVFLGLQRLIRENRRIRWSWDDFEKASAADTVEMLEQAGFPNWAQCWWDLVIRYERSKPAGFEVHQNLNITRGLWMKESIRRGLYGAAPEMTIP